jgi:molybdopterin-guanine dinucleotide biosynthesis protein A
MGRNKALLEVEGRSLIERQVNLLQSRFAEVVISSNDTTSYAFLPVPIVPDIFPGKGPLAGLHAALLHSPRAAILLLACDLPNVAPALLDLMVFEIDGLDAVVPRTADGRAHPLCALYRRSCLRIVERNLARGDSRFGAMLEDVELRVRWLLPGNGTFRDADLTNLNSPEDLAQYGEF